MRVWQTEQFRLAWLLVEGVGIELAPMPGELPCAASRMNRPFTRSTMPAACDPDFMKFPSGAAGLPITVSGALLKTVASG